MQNYIKLFQDPRFLNTLKLTFTYVLIVVVLVNLFAILIALALSKSSKIMYLLRTTFFAPILISQVAIGFMWSTIYSYDGILNYIRTGFGLSRIMWLSDLNIALYAVAAVDIWRILGFHTVIILAALYTIPQELYEAASIDGSNSFNKIRYITLPLLIPGLTVSIILATIRALQQFAIVKVLTDGGPLNVTETITYFIIDNAFQFNRKGYASAAAVILLLIMVFITAVQQNVLGKKEIHY